MVAYSFKERFVKPIQVGLSRVSLSFDPPPKRQTIRAVGLRRHARPGETLQLYFGMRTKHCRKIGDARCISVAPVKILIHNRTFIVDIDGFPLMKPAIEEFALLDGFSSTADMHQFWVANHGEGLFEGVLIRWEPLT